MRAQLQELVSLPWHVAGPFKSTGSKEGWYYAYCDDKGTNQHSPVFATKEEAEAIIKMINKKTIGEA